MFAKQQDKKPLFNFISKEIAFALDSDFSITSSERVTGGDISESYIVRNNNNDLAFFTKINTSSFLDNFSSEVLGLNTIIETNTLHVPKPIVCGKHLDYSFLVLEYLPLTSKNNEYKLGVQLAELHKTTHTQFGFLEDNFIGSTPQKNRYKNSWLEFWLENRMQPQIELAYSNGYKGPLKALSDRLLKYIPDALGDHHPQASLLHGDLWSGNKAYLDDGTPIIYDPACYYGDRETDVAMTYLFSGFEKEFYDGYNAIWPLDETFLLRRPLYNLYHQFNHLNLFGSSYLSNCISTMTSIIKENT